MDKKYNQLSIELFNGRKNHNLIKPIKTTVQNFINEMMQLLFPHYENNLFSSLQDIENRILQLKLKFQSILISLNNSSNDKINKVTDAFFERILKINNMLWEDAKAIYKGDPAAHNIDEVILAYPGFKAIAVYRFAHELYELKVPILPRILTEYAHQETGIDIHPGATIGNSFFIDHGTGIVIGETTNIGDNVKIYQGVTLGALSVNKKMAKTKRHPTIKNNVIIYAQAVILGGETVIGENSVIGGNVWLTESVPENSVVYNKSEVKLKNSNEQKPLDFII